MNAVVRVIDEHFGSSPERRREAAPLRLAAERMSARQIIRRRIADEVERLNQSRLDHAAAHARNRSFLIPIEAESAEDKLNRPRRRRAGVTLFDIEEESRRAIEAFEKRRFLLLLDDRQIEDLDDEFSLTPGSELVFLYLTPLAGG